jgi:hypothetical protein
MPDDPLKVEPAERVEMEEGFADQLRKRNHGTLFLE